MRSLGAATALAAALAACAPAPLVSDFRLCHDLALGLLRGEELSSYFRHNAGPAYPYVLALVYRVFGPWPAWVKGLNVLLLLGLGCLAARFPSRSGVVPPPALLLLVTCCSSLLPFVPLLATELPYTALLALGLIAASRGWQRSQRSLLLLSGAALGVSQAVRPVTLAFVAVLCCVALCATLVPARSNAPGLRERSTGLVRRLAPMWLAFFASATLLYASAGYGLRCQPGQNGLWSLYLGANPATLGVWNVADAQFLARIDDGSGAGAINGVLAAALRERWRAHAWENLKVWPTKLRMLMALEANLFWTWPQNGQAPRARHWLVLAWKILAGAVALAVLLACVVSTLRGGRLDLDFPFLVAVSVWLYVSTHALLLEINSRYSAPWWFVLYWLLPWALATLRDPGRGAALDVEGRAP